MKLVRTGASFCAVEGRGQFGVKHPALAHRNILIDDRHAPFAGQNFPEPRLRIRPQQPRAHQADLLTRLAQPVHRLLGLGGKGADHEKDHLRVVGAVGLHRRMLPPEFPGELRGQFVVDLKAV